MRKQFAIFGNPVSHSISPLLHNFTMASLGIEGCYGRILLENKKKFKETFLKYKLSGANITVPLKEHAFKQCDIIEGVAKDIEAVNTVVNKKGKLTGYNTDAPGFYEMIKNYSDIEKILILGAGGTSKALCVYLRKKGYEITVLNRGEKRLEYFKKNGFHAYNRNNFKISDFDLIVNTTSAGLNDNNLPAEKNVLKELLKNAKYSIDVIYNRQTPFLQMSENFNLITKDGFEMLIYQAVLAFEIFFDYKYDRKEIEKYMFFIRYLL